jgi:hypothetical protein
VCKSVVLEAVSGPTYTERVRIQSDVNDFLGELWVEYSGHPLGSTVRAAYAGPSDVI